MKKPPRDVLAIVAWAIVVVAMVSFAAYAWYTKADDDALGDPPAPLRGSRT